jgi:putative sugar O-methyltransferase
MPDSIAAAEAALAAVIRYIESEAGSSAKTALGQTSDFWRGVFSERSNFPSLCEFLAFRRSDFGYGMADERQGTIEKEWSQARRSFEIFRQSADARRMATLDEATLGAPYVFECQGVSRSAAFWTNAVTALRTKELLESFGETGRSIDVLEIGAGWGCAAHLLHQLCDINSYTVLDLPENLTLSAAYLTSTLGLKLAFLNEAAASAAVNPRSLVCGLPGAASRITRKFDLVLNSFSLQEMELATVRAYFEFIAGSLTTEGVFVSLNSHGKSGVRRPSQYPLSSFRLRRLGMFRRYPSGLLNTIPYEMVLSTRTSDGLSCDPILMDVLCCLMQFGLGDDLEHICSQFVESSLNSNMGNALRTLAFYFSPLPASRAKSLSSEVARVLPAPYFYLKAMNALANGDTVAACADFEAAIEAGLQGFARFRASAHISILKKQRSLSGWFEDFDGVMAYPELAEMLRESNLGPFAGQFERIVGVDLPSAHASLVLAGGTR